VRSRPVNGRVVALAGAAVVIAVAYAFTPYSAQGFEGQPDAAPNARYVVPALALLAPMAAWAASRRARLGVALQLAAVAGVAYAVAGTDVYHVPLDGGSVALAVVIVGAVLAFALLLRRLLAGPHRPGLRVAAAAAAVGALAAGYAGHRSYDEQRYAGIEPAIDWILQNAPGERRIGLAGLGYNPVVYPAFGPELENDVRYVGPTVDGMLRPYTRPEPLLAALRRGDYDFLIVQRQAWVRLGLPEQQENWLRADGWHVMAESERAALYAPADVR
jgi:hypothetical protein